MTSHAYTDDEIDDDANAVGVDMDIAIPVNNERKPGEGCPPPPIGTLAKNYKN